jgi:hypothetical protein
MAGALWAGSEKSAQKTRKYLLSSGKGLLVAPEKGARSQIKLPLGTKVEILGKKGAYTQVRTVYGEGHLENARLTGQKPTAAGYWALTQKTPQADLQKRIQRVRMTVGLDPSHEEAIATLEKLMTQSSQDKLALMAKRGLVAAKKRNASWDGPLYLVSDGIARLPLTCFPKPGPGAAPQKDTLTTPQLRGRAWGLVNSGKAVALTENTQKWQLLHTRVCLPHPRCEGGQAGYRVDPQGWLVAGHRKSLLQARKPAFFENQELPPCDDGCRAFGDAHNTRLVQIESGRWRLWKRSLDGWGTSSWVPFPGGGTTFRAHMILSEKVDEDRVLFVKDPQADPQRGGQAFLARVQADLQGVVSIQQGRVFDGALPKECPAPPPDQDGPPY